MKRTFFLMLSIFIASELNASLYDGCTAYYTFNSNWIDASPSDQTAVPSGAITFVEGQKGQGVYLDGIDDYISLGVFNYVDRLTITFWMKIQQTDRWHPIISKIDDTNSDQESLRHSFYLKVLGQAHENKLYFAVSEDGQKTSDIISNTSIEKEIWYHVVAMFQAGKLVLYLNGKKEIEEQSSVKQLFTSSVPVMIGTMLVNGEVDQTFANTILDELRLYNRNLSDSEIQQLYEKQSGPKILYHEPNGFVNQVVSYVDIHFNVPIISRLLTNDDLKIFEPNQHTITVNMPEKISETTYRFLFASQETNGTYRLQLGPDIYDDAGNALDQDQDGINGEDEDIYTGEFQLNATPDNVLLLNMNGVDYNTNATNIYNTLLETDAQVTYISLDASDQEELLIKRLTQLPIEYQQIWIYDTTTRDGNYLNAIDAISAWFLSKQGRQIICDGRMRASYWLKNWQTIGKKLTLNYYENLKLNGGGLLLATDQPEDQPDINAICERIGISHFGEMTTYDSVEIDQTCHLMSYPNQLDLYLESKNEASMVPTGEQSNGIYLYCVGWAPDNVNHCNISTTILPFIPADLTVHVNGNSIELAWKAPKPETNIAYYNVYLSQEQFSSISGLEPYKTNIDETSLTISSLKYGQTYYMATTAVDPNDHERKQVVPVSATTESSRQPDNDSGGCFLQTLMNE